MAQKFANNATSLLTVGIDTLATSITLASAASFPVPAGGSFFHATLIGLNSNGQESSWEIVRCTAIAANVLTVVRAQEGTVAASWGVGIRLELRMSAVFATTTDNHMDNVSNPHSTTAAQVGAPSGSGTSTGTNTGDNAANTSSQPIDAALTALAAGSDFVQFTGPLTATKVFTLPDASSSLAILAANIITSSLTIATETSHIVAGYLKVSGDLIVKGNLLVTG